MEFDNICFTILGQKFGEFVVGFSSTLFFVVGELLSPWPILWILLFHNFSLFLLLVDIVPTLANLGDFISHFSLISPFSCLLLKSYFSCNFSFQTFVLIFLFPHSG